MSGTKPSLPPVDSGSNKALGSRSFPARRPIRLLMARFMFQPRSPAISMSSILQLKPQAALIRSTCIWGATLAKMHITSELYTVRQSW